MHLFWLEIAWKCGGHKCALRTLACCPLFPQSEGVCYFFQRVEECVPLWSRLQRACR